jgi:diguanylate cyclase (GGDEF)-like protein/PAS domain S-box-containing protein
MAPHPSLRDATFLRRRHLQNWDDGRLWNVVYLARLLILAVLAAGALAVGAVEVSLAIVALIIPFTAFVRWRHRAAGKVGWLLPADQYLAGACLVLDDRVAIGVAACQVVGAVVGAVGSNRATVDRSIVLGGLLVQAAAVMHGSVAIGVFGAIATISAIGLNHFVGTMQHRYLSAHHRYEELLDGINAFVVESDVATGKVLYMNRRAREMLGGWQSSERSLLGFLHPDDRDAAIARTREAQESGKPANFEVRIQRRDGSYIDMEQRVSYSKIAASRRQRTVLIDISQRKEAERELRHRATHDALTDLPNRRLFRDRLEQSINRAVRHHRPFAVMIADLDGFKRVNDTLGHEAGDSLLVEVAERLIASVRTVDTVARLGGDEFALLIDETDRHQAAVVARRCVSTMSEPVTIAGETFNVSASFGVAIAPESGTTSDALLRAADEAMYQAKRDRDGYRIHVPDTLVDQAGEPLAYPGSAS